MRITDFIRLQNKELVESANITFKLLLPLSYGGKWFFYCNDGDTIDDLCKWVESSDKHINVDITWPYNAVSVDEDGEKFWFHFERRCFRRIDLEESNTVE